MQTVQNVLETNSLTKRYRGFSALNGLTMHIPKGSIYGFFGRNGGGKTTLIRLICGLQEPTDGDYMLYGVKHGERGIGRCRRRMGAVVESPSVYMDMTAAENIRQQYRVLGVPSDDGIDELLELVGLGDTASKKVKNFSLGMRQRLGIATALSGDPDFLVLDEPINGLDPQGIIEMRELILRLNRERGITVLISSHILDELSRLATHYGFIDGGRMIKEMSAKELEKRCRKCMRIEVSDTRILARVLDSMNAEYCILDEHNADIYADIGVTALVFALGTGFPFLHYYNNLNYGESLTPDSTSFAFVFFVPILLSCAAPLFIGSEYSDGTMRNKLIVGHKRYNIYLSEQFVCTAAGFMLCLAYIVPHTVLSLILLGKFESALDKLAAYVGVSCALIIALNAVFTAFSMLCRHKAYSTAVCILLVFALLFVGIGITSALNEPEYYVGYTYTENDITTSDEAEPNPNYLSGTKREIYEFLNDFTSGGQMLKLAGINSEKPAVLALYDGLITLAATVLGVILFRRKDLK